MSDHTGDLDRLLARLAEEGHGLEEHPASEKLSAYRARELPPEEHDAIQEHLATCTLCADRLLDLGRFLAASAEESPQGVADFETAAEWRRLRERLAKEDGESKPRPEDARRLLRRLQAFQALAAVLGVLVLGLSVYTFHQGQPEQILLPGKPLYFAEVRSSGQEKPERIQLPCALVISTGADYPRYRIEILSGDRLRYVAETGLDSGVIPLRKGDLSPGRYTVRVSGQRNGGFEAIEEKTLVVEP